jgi:hypothetical protein
LPGRRPDRLLHDVDEGRHIVVGHPLPLVDPSHEVGIDHRCPLPDRSGILGRHHAEPGPRLGGQHLDLEPRSEPRLVGEQGCHLGKRVAPDQGRITSRR